MPKMLPRPRRIWRSIPIIWLPRCRLPTISTGSSRWPTTCWPRIPRANVRLQAYANKKDYAKVIELGQAAADAQTDPADKSLMYYLLGAAYNAKEMKPQAIAAFKQVTDGPAAENAKAALAG